MSEAVVENSSRDRPAYEIVVTPAMVKAGVAELRLSDSADPPASTAKAVFVAMAKAALAEET